MADYVLLKGAVLRYIKAKTRTDVPDVVLNYGPGQKYNAKTSLGVFGLSPEVLSTRSRSFNNAMYVMVGGRWIDIGPFDLEPCNAIGDLINLACAMSGTVVPEGEPT